MHNARYMVGARPANYDVSIVRRYFRFSKHRKPGRIIQVLLGVMMAIEIKAVAYAR